MYNLSYQATDEYTYWCDEVLVVSRNKQQLESIAKKLKEKHGKEFFVNKVDVKNSLNDLEIEELLNRSY